MRIGWAGCCEVRGDDGEGEREPQCPDDVPGSHAGGSRNQSSRLVHRSYYFIQSCLDLFSISDDVASAIGAATSAGYEHDVGVQYTHDALVTQRPSPLTPSHPPAPPTRSTICTIESTAHAISRDLKPHAAGRQTTRALRRSGAPLASSGRWTAEEAAPRCTSGGSHDSFRPRP